MFIISCGLTRLLCRKRFHFLCESTLETAGGDVGGFSPAFNQLQLDLLPLFTHLQFKYILNN